MEIAVEAHSALVQVGDGSGSGKVVLGIDGTGVQGDLVVLGGVNGVERERQVFGLAVAAGHREAYVEAAIPSVHEAGVEGFVVGELLGVVAHHGYVPGGCFDAAGFGGDVELAVRSGDGTDRRFPALQTD